jgi:hypothetical protein
MGHMQPEKYHRKKRYLTWNEKYALRRALMQDSPYMPAGWLERAVWWMDDHPWITIALFVTGFVSCMTIAFWFRK